MVDTYETAIGVANEIIRGKPSHDGVRQGNTTKYKAMVDSLLYTNAQQPPAKEIRLEQLSQAGPSVAPTGNETVFEEDVRRHRKRQPMTSTDLVKQFTSKKTGIQNSQLPRLLASAITKINPCRNEKDGATYFNLKDKSKSAKNSLGWDKQAVGESVVRDINENAVQ